MDKIKEDTDIPRGQELYLRYIFLFGKAVPLTIKAAIKKLAERRGESLKTILVEKKGYIQKHYHDLYNVLFYDKNTNFDAQMGSWTIITLCQVFFVIKEESNADCVTCIYSQRRDLDKYARTASLDYKTFKSKWETLSESLRTLYESTDTELECKRLLYNFNESVAIQLGNEVYESLRGIVDADKQIEFVKGYDLSFLKDPECENVPEDPENVEVIQPLSDKYVQFGDTITLHCQFNKPYYQICWLKDGKNLEETNKVFTLSKREFRFLVVLDATAKDSGTYTCTYKDSSTSASVIVSGSGLCVEKPLHCENNGDIREMMEVFLSCTINLPGKTPRWFHNNKEIEANNPRVTISSMGYDHKLTIHHVKEDDDGKYCVLFDNVSSKTSIRVQDGDDLILKTKLAEDSLKNWIRGMLALRYLKTGLEPYTDKAVKDHHENILKDLPSHLSDVKCSECNNKKNTNPRKGRIICPSGLCNEIYDKIVRDYRFKSPSLKNTNMDNWKTDRWSVAACYISSTHASDYQYKTTSKDLDCSDLLSLFINNKTFLPNTNYGVFDMAKRHRHHMMHNPTYELSEKKLNEYLKDFRDVLEVKNHSNEMIFAQYPAVKSSLKALKKVQNYDIDIYTKEGIERLVDAGLEEDRELINNAIIKNNEDIRQLKESLKGDQKQVNRCGKHNGTPCTWCCPEHALHFCKSCKEKEHSSCSRLWKTYEDKSSPVSIELTQSRQLSDRVIAVCALPDGEYFAQLKSDTGILRFCKLIATFESSVCCRCVNELGESRLCYIGNNTVVILYRKELFFMDVEALKMNEKAVNLNCEAQSVACHGDVIYIFDGKLVYTYSTDGIPKSNGPLCSLPFTVADSYEGSISVSHDGESIYCIGSDTNLYKVDSSNGEAFLLLKIKEHKHFLPKLIKSIFFGMFSRETYEVKQRLYVCCIGNAECIVLGEHGTIVHVNREGKCSFSSIDGIKDLRFAFLNNDKLKSYLILFVADGNVLNALRVGWQSDTQLIYSRTGT